MNKAEDIVGLTAALARGEEAVFHEFHRIYCARLLRYLFVVTGGDEELAREALQETFVRVARRVRVFESESAFWNWLAVVARNCAADEARKRHRYRNLLTRFFSFRAEPELPTADVTVLEECLLAALALLPKEESALLERKYFTGELIRDLAAENGMSEKAMESHLLRLRRKLKVILTAHLRDEIER